MRFSIVARRHESQHCHEALRDDGRIYYLIYALGFRLWNSAQSANPDSCLRYPRLAPLGADASDRQSGLFLRCIRVDNVTGLILGWVENRLGRQITKVVDAMAFDILELNQ